MKKWETARNEEIEMKKWGKWKEQGRLQLVAKYLQVLYRFSTSTKPNEVAIYYTGASLSEHHLVSTTAPLSIIIINFFNFFILYRRLSFTREKPGR